MSKMLKCALMTAQLSLLYIRAACLLHRSNRHSPRAADRKFLVIYWTRMPCMPADHLENLPQSGTIHPEKRGKPYWDACTFVADCVPSLSWFITYASIAEPHSCRRSLSHRKPPHHRRRVNSTQILCNCFYHISPPS